MTARGTLVLGGTGKTGRRVAERLWDRGLPVRIGSRAARIPFDWEHPATWKGALENVGAAYVSGGGEARFAPADDVERASAASTYP